MNTSESKSKSLSASQALLKSMRDKIDEHLAVERRSLSHNERDKQTHGQTGQTEELIIQ